MKAVLLTLVIFFCAQPALAAFIDRGEFTTITDLGIDVYDVDSFVNLTHQEVIDKVENMGGNWYFASTQDVIPIFGLLDESTYLNSIRHMLGSYSVDHEENTYYFTEGRVADTYSTSPGYNYLWGFGNHVSEYIHELEITEYGWASFGIGWESVAETRFENQGAWVIRTSPVPLPASIYLFAMGIISLFYQARHNNRRRS